MQAAARPISKTDPGPARAAGAILEDAEQRSERVLAWLRLIALVVLVLVERIFDLNSHVFVFSLGAYGAATLLALALARGRTHRPWLGWVLTTLDTALVLHFAATLVFIGDWSTSDAMVAPGVLMIFLVLAQGAVRYRPELVLHAAGLFLGGWVLLHFAADPIAEDHLRHWRGDEAALAAVVALTALALVAAAGRARRLLAAAIAESRLRAALSRFVPAKLVEELSRDHGAAGHLTGRTHRVAVLFIDIRGFTTIVEDLRPEQVLDLLNEYRRRVTRPVLDHGGVIDKFIGDAVMVVFGVPHGRSTDPADALRCSLAVLNSISEWNVERARHGNAPVEIGIGAHYGEAIVGVVGDDERLEYTVLGDTVNLAQRAERLAARSKAPLLVTRDLLDAARRVDPAIVDPREWTDLRPVTVKGRRKPVAFSLYRSGLSQQQAHTRQGALAGQASPCCSPLRRPPSNSVNEHEDEHRPLHGANRVLEPPRDGGTPLR